jgi:hypothetical protein
MPVPVYVFIAGSKEFTRFEKEFNTLYTLAGEIQRMQENETTAAGVSSSLSKTY